MLVVMASLGVAKLRQQNAERTFLVLYRLEGAKCALRETLKKVVTRGGKEGAEAAVQVRRWLRELQKELVSKEPRWEVTSAYLELLAGLLREPPHAAPPTP